MSDPSIPEEYRDWLPHDEDADQGDVPQPGTLAGDLFIEPAIAMTVDEFRAYVAGYNFGGTPPDFVVLHHTAIPSLKTWGDSDPRFDDVGAFKQQRLRKTEILRNIYRNGKKWNTGPHLFIDDRFIWVFAEMREPGIHAMWGNSHRRDGKLHYSIGIEVVGDYTREQWPPAMAQLVGDAVAALKQRLGSFELTYMYADPNSKPGRAASGFAAAFPDRLRHGGIASHRDYNKPACPGDAITDDYYIGVLQAAWARLNPAPVIAQAEFSLATPIVGAASGTAAAVSGLIRSRLPETSEYSKDVETIMALYWQHAPAFGVDPFVAAVQCVHETDGLQSAWAARPRRNPAGLGVAQEGGLSFASWDAAVQAHLAQLLAFARRDDELSPAQQELLGRNPRHSQIGGELRGAVRSVGDLSGTWANDPNYGASMVARAAQIV